MVLSSISSMAQQPTHELKATSNLLWVDLLGTTFDRGISRKLTTINLLYWLHISKHMLRTNTLQNSFALANLQLLQIIFSFLLPANLDMHCQVFAFKLRAIQAGDLQLR